VTRDRTREYERDERQRRVLRLTPRARTVSIKRMRTSQLRADEAETIEHTERPRTWGECLERALGTASRPCGYLRCKHNLLVDVDGRTGSYKVTWPHLAVGAYGDEYGAYPQHTCALRVAEQGGMTLEEIGQVMNLTRERVRQIETKALYALRSLAGLVAAVDDELDGAPAPGRGSHGDLAYHAWEWR
jgi:hypothetical protein